MTDIAKLKAEMREAAEILENAPESWTSTAFYNAVETYRKATLASNVLALIADHDALREAARAAVEALEAAEPWVEAGPAGRWRDGTMAKLSAALANLKTALGD